MGHINWGNPKIIVGKDNNRVRIYEKRSLEYLLGLSRRRGTNRTGT
jgi:hypothetical protein